MIAGLYIAAILIAYFLGSLPFGVIISRLMGGKDVRRVGSGKTGTTNVMRAAGKKAAAIALVMDIAKGVLAVFLAGIIMGDRTPHLAQALAGAAAIGGHTWSVFLGFRGGRGVATFIGCLLAMYWPAGVVGGIAMVGIGLQTRYMSLGSITGAVIAFFYMMAFHVLQVNFLLAWPPLHFVVFSLCGAIFIYVVHRDNISRLVNGTERRIGEKPSAGTGPSSNNPTLSGCN
jgi:glycerol-3-phosphate acyltransferase PlsY